MKAIEVKDLVKEYGNVRAVGGISFSVEEGSFFAFLGENGAGKSTTINILSTLLRPTSGEVRMLGYRLGRDDREIRSSIGIVFQGSVLDGKLTVEENLVTRGSYYGLSKKQTLQRLERFWESFELEEIRRQRYDTLSGGQRRRVDLVRGLIHDPKILFLDEPTTGLDPLSRQKLWSYIKALRETSDTTIFLTTHYLEETESADNVVIMKKGSIIAEGTPTELKNRYTGRKIVWYTEENPEHEGLLGEQRHSYELDHYNIFPQGSATDFLWAHRGIITDYEVVKGSMDEVFLAQG